MKNKFTFLKYKIIVHYAYIKCWLTCRHNYLQNLMYNDEEKNFYNILHYKNNNFIDICNKCGKHRRIK